MGLGKYYGKEKKVGLRPASKIQETKQRNGIQTVMGKN